MSHDEQIRKLQPADGDVFVLPEGSPESLARALAEAIAVAKPGVKAMVVCGDVRKLSLAQMNAAGWYRA